MTKVSLVMHLQNIKKSEIHLICMNSQILTPYTIVDSEDYQLLLINKRAGRFLKLQIFFLKKYSKISRNEFERKARFLN